MLQIKKLRQAGGLSQEALARRAGLSVKTVRRAERTGRANSETVRVLADALGAPVGDLFTGQEQAS